MKKYGRTFHLPMSPGATNDDKIMPSIKCLMTHDILVTEKMDGENTTIHSQGTYARSPDSRYHRSRDWMKGFAASISLHLEKNERIVGENLFARHSINYDSLPSYFMGFSWIIGDEIQPWDSTLIRFEALGITPVYTIYRGPFKEGLFEKLASSLDTLKHEGFVARVAGAFRESDMKIYMGKYVRAGHVQSEIHWMHTDLIPNRLANS